MIVDGGGGVGGILTTNGRGFPRMGRGRGVVELVELGEFKQEWGGISTNGEGTGGDGVGGVGGVGGVVGVVGVGGVGCWR